MVMVRSVESSVALRNFYKCLSGVQLARQQTNLIEGARLLLAAKDAGRKVLAAPDRRVIAPYFQRVATEQPQLGQAAVRLLASTKVLPIDELHDLLGIPPTISQKQSESTISANNLDLQQKLGS